MSARIRSWWRSPTPSGASAWRHSPSIDLIDANLQDQRVDTYEDWPSLRGYCALSAAPVGRIVLRLFDIRDPSAVALSDDVCIGLQLANFAQDVSVDRRLGRTYLLQRDIREHGVDGATRAMSSGHGDSARFGSRSGGAGTAAAACPTRPLPPRWRFDS